VQLLAPFDQQGLVAHSSAALPGGVEIKVKGKQIGVELSLDLSGLQIDLKK
jgi:hypothetical protein